jgi:hypothetical protein
LPDEIAGGVDHDKTRDLLGMEPRVEQGDKTAMATAPLSAGHECPSLEDGG